MDSTLNLDKQRVSLLLSINTLLIQKSVTIQAQTHQLQAQQSPQQVSKLNELLQHLLMRLHANLTCIGKLSELHNSSIPNPEQSKNIFPTILNPPPDFLELNGLYLQLQQLFPEGVRAVQNRLKSQALQQQQQQQGQQPGPQGPQQLGHNNNNIQLNGNGNGNGQGLQQRLSGSNLTPEQLNLLKRQATQFNNQPQPPPQQFW